MVSDVNSKFNFLAQRDLDLNAVQEITKQILGQKDNRVEEEAAAGSEFNAQYKKPNLGFELYNEFSQPSMVNEIAKAHAGVGLNFNNETSSSLDFLRNQAAIKNLSDINKNDSKDKERDELVELTYRNTVNGKDNVENKGKNEEVDNMRNSFLKLTEGRNF